MYIVKNIVRGKVVLGDLNLILAEGQSADIDALHPREKLERSSNLKGAIAKGLLQVIHKDSQTPEYGELAAEIEKRVREQISSQLANLKVPQNGDLENKLDAILSVINSGKFTVSTATKAEEVDESKQGVDDDVLVDIHARAVKRVTKDVEGHVDTEDKVKESDVSKRANELEDLI